MTQHEEKLLDEALKSLDESQATWEKAAERIVALSGEGWDGPYRQRLNYVRKAFEAFKREVVGGAFPDKYW